jgi:hypothetical protein
VRGYRKDGIFKDVYRVCFLEGSWCVQADDLAQFLPDRQVVFVVTIDVIELVGDSNEEELSGILKAVFCKF